MSHATKYEAEINACCKFFDSSSKASCHRACVITHNDLLYTQKTHSVVDSQSIVRPEEKKIIYLFINSRRWFIVATSTDVHSAKSVLTLS